MKFKKSVVLMGVFAAGLLSCSMLTQNDVFANEDNNGVVFAPKASKAECEDDAGCVYQEGNGMLVFVLPSYESLK